MMDLFRQLRRRDDGVASVEFALWSTFFFVIIMVALDFGSLYLQRGKLNEAVGAAAVASFNNADNVSFGSLPLYVRGLTEDQSTAVTVSCNGSAGACTNFNRTCACLKQDGTYVANSCGNTCSGPGMTTGSTAGYYLTINASRSFDPMMVPRSVLSGASVSQQATVRLQ